MKFAKKVDHNRFYKAKFQSVATASRKKALNRARVIIKYTIRRREPRSQKLALLQYLPNQQTVES